MTRAMTVFGVGVAVALSACAAGMRRPLVKAEPSCRNVSVPIYFEPNQAELTRDGRRVIALAAADARRCTIEQVQVLGLADAAGDPAANLELSKRRADSVGAALRAARLPAAEFTVAAAGDAGSVTSKGAVTPVRRRADVVLKLSSPK